MTAITPAPRRSRRILVPLATLAAAGALVVGSGASFSSQTVNPANIVTAGTLTQANSRANTAIFNVDNIKPGDTVTGTVTITNTGTLPALFSVTEKVAPLPEGKQPFTPGTLTMTIFHGTNQIFSGNFGGDPTKDDKYELGRFNPGEARTYTYTVKLAQGATNVEQGKTAGATYTWDGVQTPDVTVDETPRTSIVTSVNANP